ncbi:MAG: hypothetical protein IJ705_08230 [Oscillospiraceae bacterium]|nr:hypothetical protein [Oscillospiraceae bacterium]
MSNFTPGPWEALETADIAEPYLILAGEPKHIVARTRFIGNARLIAAAPEIADSLKEIIRGLETINDFNNSLFDGMGSPLRIHPKLIDRAKALLRRIEEEE